MKNNQATALNQLEKYISIFLILLLCTTIIFDLIPKHEHILLMISFFSIYIFYKYHLPLSLGVQTRRTLYLFLSYYVFFLLHTLISSLFFGWDDTRIDLLANAAGVLCLIYLINMLKIDPIFIHRVLLTCILTIVFILVFEPIYAIQHLGSYRLGRYFSEIGEFGWIAGSIMLLSITYTLYALKHKSYKTFTIFTFLSLALLIAVITSGTRSFWIGLPFIGSFLLYITWKAKLASIKLILLLIALCITVSVVLANTNNPVSRGINILKQDFELKTEGDSSGSLNQRISMYIISFDLIKENLLWGISDANYPSKFTQTIKNRPDIVNKSIVERMAQYSHVHNHFLMDFLTRGLVGLLLSIAVLLIPIIYFLKVLKNNINQIHCLSFWYALAGCVFMFGSFFYFQFNAVLYYTHGLLFFWIPLFLISAGIDHANYQQNEHS